jgi:hypothetical protein
MQSLVISFSNFNFISSIHFCYKCIIVTLIINGPLFLFYCKKEQNFYTSVYIRLNTCNNNNNNKIIIMIIIIIIIGFLTHDEETKNLK